MRMRDNIYEQCERRAVSPQQLSIKAATIVDFIRRILS